MTEEVLHDVITRFNMGRLLLKGSSAMSPEAKKALYEDIRKYFEQPNMNQPQPPNEGNEIEHPAITAAKEIAIMELRHELAAVTKERDIAKDNADNHERRADRIQRMSDGLMECFDTLKKALHARDCKIAGLMEIVLQLEDEGNSQEPSCADLRDLAAQASELGKGNTIAEEIEALKSENERLKATFQSSERRDLSDEEHNEIMEDIDPFGQG